jgi:hypothetical protein
MKRINFCLHFTLGFLRETQSISAFKDLFAIKQVLCAADTTIYTTDQDCLKYCFFSGSSYIIA